MTLRVVLFHPAFVHFPIAFAFLECGLLVAGVLSGDPTCRRSANWVGRAGFFSTTTAVISGLIGIGGFMKISEPARPHVWSAFILFVCWALRLFLERHVRFSENNAVLAGSVATCMLVTVTAYWGGRLVY